MLTLETDKSEGRRSMVICHWSFVIGPSVVDISMNDLK